MKTIGLLGGMSWESTIPYYQIINEAVRKKMGGLHSAKVLLNSVEFAEIEACQSSGDWEKSAQILGAAAKGLENAGADLILICTNTMHKVAPQIQQQISIPILHIADATADVLHQHGIKKVALLGTRYTMQQDFYKSKLVDAGIDTLVPEGEDADLVNRVIFEELCMGILSDKSQQEFQRIIRALAAQGAEGVILGCTEIGLLIHQEDSPIPVFDTTVIHAEKAAELAMN